MAVYSRNVTLTTVRSMPLTTHHLLVCGTQCYCLEFRFGTHCSGNAKRRNFWQQRQLYCKCQGAGKWTVSKLVLDCWPSYSTMWRYSGSIHLVVFYCRYVLKNFSHVSTYQIYSFFPCNTEPPGPPVINMVTALLLVCLGLLLVTTAYSTTA